MLEPELASRALPRAHFALIDRLDAINHAVARMAAAGRRHRLHPHQPRVPPHALPARPGARDPAAHRDGLAAARPDHARALRTAPAGRAAAVPPGHPRGAAGGGRAGPAARGADGRDAGPADAEGLSAEPSGNGRRRGSAGLDIPDCFAQPSLQPAPAGRATPPPLVLGLPGGRSVSPLRAPLPRPAPPRPVHDARALAGPGGQATLRLDDQAYTLRITRAGKLILTK